jgi:alpha,alpha-trehalase
LSVALDTGHLAALRGYIKHGWASLTRSHRDLVAAAQDPKVAHAAGSPWVVYVASDAERARAEAQLATELDVAQRGEVVLRTLPADRQMIAEHGLLYLPRPYVVPGGRFNEMYGWDSYFIVLGLLRDGEVARARDVADDLLYEVNHYGAVLNANRTYYLTRSQPPLLTETVLAVFRATGDRAWLAAALPAIEQTYALWMAPPHLIPSLGLSRYFDRGDGPAPEVVGGERDAEGRTHYDRVRAYYRSVAVTDYPVDKYYDRAKDVLLPLFYKGDRSMRESGFDPTNRFGPFAVDIIHYAPVCLNVLLAQMEQEAAEINTLLGRPQPAAAWAARAQNRRQLIDRYLWDAEAGLYFDYNFETGRRRRYPFATTFYPLWAGLASPAQAARVRGNLGQLERPGGIVTSTTVSGNQWDAPFGWAPLQWFAVRGLQRYGYGADARRIARAFVALVAAEFATNGTVVEKYDVVRATSDVASAIRFGYSENQIGFGWTNGVVLEFLGVIE